jgi:type IV pilus assembly protein PilF
MNARNPQPSGTVAVPSPLGPERGAASRVGVLSPTTAMAPRRSVRRRAFPALAPVAVAGLTLAVAAAASVGCGAGGREGGAASGPGAQSSERQSEAEYDLARDAFYKGQPRTALDHALKAASLDDQNAKALYFTSTIYLWFCSTDAGLKAPDCRLADAETFARRALKADDTFRDARNLLGQVLILEKKYDEAIATLELRNSITQPRFCVGDYRLGVAFEKKGDLVEAEKSLTDAVSVESPDCQNLQDAWEARARVRMKLGKVADGRADFERCREISADSVTGKSCSARVGPGGTVDAPPQQQQPQQQGKLQ